MKKKVILNGLIAFFCITGSELPALTEDEYRAKYSFAVDQHLGDFVAHPAGRYRVFTQFGVRECDIDGGNVRVLAFYDGETLIRSYSLEQLFPNRDTWRFHRASGVFLWLMFNPKVDGFHGDVYSVLTVAGVRSFNVSTGGTVELTQAVAEPNHVAE